MKPTVVSHRVDKECSCLSLFWGCVNQNTLRGHISVDFARSSAEYWVQRNLPLTFPPQENCLGFVINHFSWGGVFFFPLRDGVFLLQLVGCVLYGTTRYVLASSV